MSLIDLMDAYFQIPIHPDSRLNLQITLGAKFIALLWRDSTYAISGQLVGDCRVGSSLASMSLAIPSAKDLGVVINMEESDLKPTSKAQCLWMLIDTIRERIFLTDSQIVRFKIFQADYFSQLILQRCGSSCWATWHLWKGCSQGTNQDTPSSVATDDVLVGSFR